MFDVFLDFFYRVLFVILVVDVKFDFMRSDVIGCVVIGFVIIGELFRYWY